MPNLEQFYIIRPEATTNLCENPSFETGTTGWAANGGSIARSTTRARYGRYSLQHTPSSTSTSSVRYGSFSHTSSATMTAQCWGYWENGVEYRMRFLTGGGSGYGSATVWTGAGKWEKKEVTATSSGSSSMVEIGKSGGTGTASTNPYWIDGIQIEEKAYSTTYCDGDQPGCYWQFAKHGSKSTRFANHRAGGRKIELTDFDSYITDLGGLGAPTIEVAISSSGYSEGGVFQKSSVKPRQFVLSISLTGTDLNDWAINQEGLFNLVKPDLVYPEQPFILGWQENGNDVEIACKYGGGLEGQGEKLNDVSTIALNLSAADPFWYETIENVATLTNADRIGLTNWVYRGLPTGGAIGIASGANEPTGGSVICAFAASDGYIYFGGDFTAIGGVAANRFARYNPQTGVFSAVGTGYNGAVRCMAEANGILFVGGSFTTANSVTCNGVSMYNLSAGTFATTLSITGITGTPNVYGIALVPEYTTAFIMGKWVVAGNNIGGRTHDWVTGLVNSGLGSANISHTTNANLQGNVAVRDGNLVYIGGCFTSMSPVTTNGVAVFNIDTRTWSAVGGGLSAATAGVTDICPDGIGGVHMVYAGGTLGGISNNAYWNGSSYSAISQIIQMFNQIPSGAQGEVLTAGRYPDKRFSGIFRMNRTSAQQTFFMIDDDSLGVNVSDILPLAVGKDGSIYGATSSGAENLYVTQTTTVTNNGSAHAFPTIKIIGPTTSSVKISYLPYIRNVTTGQTIIFNSIITEGEEITIDLASDSPSVVSNVRGNFPELIQSGGDISGFHLAPGANTIECGCYDEDDPSSAVIYFQWKNRHWTFHGGHI